MSTLLFPSLPHFSSCFIFSVRKHEWQLRWRLIPGDGLRLHCPAHTCFPLPSMPDLWPTQPQSLSRAWGRGGGYRGWESWSELLCLIFYLKRTSESTAVGNTRSSSSLTNSYFISYDILYPMNGGHTLAPSSKKKFCIYIAREVHFLPDLWCIHGWLT